jgi:hypothetical protein
MRSVLPWSAPPTTEPLQYLSLMNRPAAEWRITVPPHSTSNKRCRIMRHGQGELHWAQTRALNCLYMTDFHCSLLQLELALCQGSLVEHKNRLGVEHENTGP